MTADQVRRRLAAIPFRQFELCLADGRALLVEHPDLLAFGDKSRVVVLCKKDSAVEVVDLMLVLSIRFSEPDFVHSDSPAAESKAEDEP